MSLRINNNSAALVAHRNLSGTDSSLNKSIERLSSGFKINSAGDDPAGLVISEKLRAQVSGLGQAISNAGDAVNMVKTAEGALNEVNKLLRSMRDLAVHAANTGANDDAATQADQSQIRSAIDSINKIASETQFGNKKLLDGSAGLTAKITGSAVMAADISKANITGGLTGVEVKVTTAATKASLTGTADITAVNLTAESITINGVQITGGATLGATKNAINAKSNETGVVATDDGAGHLKLTQKEFGSSGKIVVTATDAQFVNATAAAAVGVNAVAQVRQSGGGADISDASWAAGSGSTIKDSLGNAIQLTDTEAALATDKLGQFDVEAGTLTFQVGAYADQTRQMNIASVAADQLGLANATMGAVANLSQIDVGVDAQAAIKVLDKAISDVSSQRASLGSVQKNTLESSINSLTIAKENISASESSIRDTDVAAEMVNFTKNQILAQAGTAMLAQANQAPQQLLRLLQ